MIQGFAASYAGKGEEANETYRYFAPALSTTDRLLKELNRDQQVFTDFIVDTSKVVTAVAERRDDLTGLVSNANQALGAVASQNEAFDRSLRGLPPTLRQANTTFVNLRAALDDLDPLVNTSKRATKDLEPFLEQLRPVVRRAVPVFGNLSRTVSLPGPVERPRRARQVARPAASSRRRGLALRDQGAERLPGVHQLRAALCA